MAKIILVEENQDLLKSLKNLLIAKGYDVKAVSKGAEALLALEKEVPDLVLLDQKISDFRGESICWEIRKENPDLPIIMMVDELSEENVRRMFKAGADDFASKPINVDNLLARVQAQFISQNPIREEYEVSDLKINLKEFRVSRSGKEIRLTPREFRLLRYLAQNKNQVLTRSMILDRIWSYDSDVQSRAVDVYIGYLRKKIDNGSKKPLIQTVRGFGYMIKE